MTDSAKRLSDGVIRKLALSQSGQYVVRDTEVRGFQIVVGKTTRTFTVEVGTRSLGARKCIKRAIGRFGKLSTREARAKARQLIVEIQSGSGAGRANGGTTLREAWDLYRASLIKKGRRPRTIDFYSGTLNRYLSGWMNAPLARLSRDAVLVAERHSELTRGPGAVTANHAMRVLRAIYNHARKIDRELPPENPVSAVTFNRESRRDTGMSVEELPEWWNQLQQLDNPIRREFHLLCLLTASRPNALCRARWEHVDWDRSILHFPDPKGGPSRAFDLPLSTAIASSLSRLKVAGEMIHPIQSSLGWMFPSESRTGHLVEYKEDRKRLGKWGGDLRQTWRTIAEVAGIEEVAKNLLMNHKLEGVNAGYITSAALLSHLAGQQERMSEFLVRSMASSGFE